MPAKSGGALVLRSPDSDSQRAVRDMFNQEEIDPDRLTFELAKKLVTMSLDDQSWKSPAFLKVASNRVKALGLAFEVLKAAVGNGEYSRVEEYDGEELERHAKLARANEMVKAIPHTGTIEISVEGGEVEDVEA